MVTERLQKRHIVQLGGADIVAVLNCEDPANRFFEIYDTRRGCFVRRKHDSSIQDTFTVDSKHLAYTDGENLVVKLIRIPNSAALADVLRPRFHMARLKLSPGTMSVAKAEYKDKVYNMLHAYHYFKDYPDRAQRETGMTEIQNVQMMCWKYDDATDHPFKMKANRELMMLQKVLLRDAYKSGAQNLQAKTPLQGIKQPGLKRIEIYDDELKFPATTKDFPRSQIDQVVMSNEPHRNFFLISIQNKVYKYDLVTKELLFSFKTPCESSLMLYEEDDKLLAADDDELRLWDFPDTKEDIPELIASVELDRKQFTVDKIFSFHVCKDGVKSPHFVLISNGNSFKLYTNRLEGEK
jgi:hypothetical protein